MSEIIDFIKDNLQMIILIVIVILSLLVLMKIKDINLNVLKPESKLVQQVTVETFSSGVSNPTENIEFNPSDNFCASYLGNSEELEKSCNQLTETNCAQTSCCVYGQGKCVAGGSEGPTYKTDKDGKLITMDTYFYLGNKSSS